MSLGLLRSWSALTSTRGKRLGVKPLHLERAPESCRGFSSGGTAGGDPVDDGAVIILFIPNETQKFCGEDIMGLKKPSVAAAAKHQAGGQLAAELGPGFRNDAWQPFDSAGGSGLGGKL